MAVLLSTLGISQSVGRGGRNHFGDVRNVQQLLAKHASAMPPAPPAGITGTCDDRTVALIAVFQRSVLKMPNPTGLVEPAGPTLLALNGTGKRSVSKDAELDRALEQFRTASVNFGNRFIKDSKVRAGYIAETQRLAREVRAEVAAGKLKPRDGAAFANATRNEILEAARLRSSDIGRAKAESLKKTGKSLPDLQDYYSKQKFGRAFHQLTGAEKKRVFLEIVDASGRPQPKVNAKVARYGKLGRGLVVASIGIAVYNIATAENKAEASAREGAGFAGGAIGGAAGGGLAGLACGPGAPVCVTVGVFVGGALGALGADFTFDWLTGK